MVAVTTDSSLQGEMRQASTRPAAPTRGIALSKWDEYQNFSTAAGKAGGVLKHLANIEKNAVDAAKPGLLTKGGVIGGVVTAVVMYGGKRYLDKRASDQARADESKRQLVAEFGDDEVKPESGPEGGEADTKTEPGSNDD